MFGSSKDVCSLTNSFTELSKDFLNNDITSSKLGTMHSESISEYFFKIQKKNKEKNPLNEKHLKEILFSVITDNCFIMSREKVEKILNILSPSSWKISGWYVSKNLFEPLMGQNIKLSELELYGCFFEDKNAIEALSSFIRQSKTLRTVVLWGCNINDFEANTILKSLVKNDSVLFADIGCNRIQNTLFSNQKEGAVLPNRGESSSKLIIDFAGNKLSSKESMRIPKKLFLKWARYNHPSTDYNNFPFKRDDYWVFDAESDDSMWKTIKSKNKVRILFFLDALISEKPSQQNSVLVQYVSIKFSIRIKEVFKELCESGEVNTLNLLQLLRLLSLMPRTKYNIPISCCMYEKFIQAFLNQLEKTHIRIIEKFLNRAEGLKIDSEALLDLWNVIIEKWEFKSFNNERLIKIFFFFKVSCLMGNEKMVSPICKELKKRAKTLNLQQTIDLGWALVKGKRSTNIHRMTIVNRLKKLENSFKKEEVSPDDILRAFVTCCILLMKDYDTYSYDVNNEEKKSISHVIYFLCETFNSSSTKVISERGESYTMNMLGRFLSRELEEYVDNEVLVNIFYKLSQLEDLSNHRILEPFQQLFMQKWQDLKDPEEIYRTLDIYRAFSTLGLLNSSEQNTKKLISTLTVEQSQTESCLLDILNSYRDLCELYKSPKFIMKIFSTCKNLIEKVEKEKRENIGHFFQIIADISSLIHLLKNSFHTTSNVSQKNLFLLQSGLKSLLTNVVEILNSNESELENMTLIDLANIYFSICIEGDFNRYKSLCDQLYKKIKQQNKSNDDLDKLQTIKKNVILNNLDWSDKVFNRYKEKLSDLDGLVVKFTTGNWKKKAEALYQIANIINEGDIHDNYKPLLKNRIPSMVNKTISLDNLDLAKILFSLATIEGFEKDFENIKRMFEKGCPPNKSHKKEYAIFKEALKIRKIGQKRNSSSKQVNKTLDSTTRTISNSEEFELGIDKPNLDRLFKMTQFLQCIPIFREIPIEKISQVARIAKEITLQRETKLFSEGDSGRSLFIIRRGSVRIHKGQNEIAIQKTGDFFGEMSLFDGRPRSASVTTTEVTEFLEIKGEDFDFLLQEMEIYKGIAQELARRIRSNNEQTVTDNELREQRKKYDSLSAEEKIKEKNDYQDIYNHACLVFNGHKKKENSLINLIRDKLMKELNKLDSLLLAHLLLALAVLKEEPQKRKHIKKILESRNIKNNQKANEIYTKALIVEENKSIAFSGNINKSRRKKLFYRKKSDVKKASVHFEQHCNTVYLSKVNLFKNMPIKLVSQLANSTKEVVLQQREILFSEGDCGDSMYFILEGGVQIHLKGKNLTVFRKENFFGELALIDGKPRSASVTALEYTKLLKIKSNDFEDFMYNNPDVRLEILKELIERIRKNNPRKRS